MDEYYARTPASMAVGVAFVEAFNALQMDRSLIELGKARLPEPGDRLPPSQLKQIKECLEVNARCLELLRIAAAHESCRYPIDLAKGFELEMPHLAAIRKATDLLILEATYCADTGKGNRAAEALQTVLALAASLNEEPVTLSYLVQTAVLVRTCRVLEWCLERSDMPAANMDLIRNRLLTFLPDRTYRRALIGERCMGIALFESPLSTLERVVGERSPGFRQGVANYRRTGSWTRDYESYLRAMAELDTIQTLPPPERLARATALKKSISANKGKADPFEVNIVSGMLLPSILGNPEKELRRETELRLTLTALSLRHADQAGGLPAWANKLEAVPALSLPQFMVDPFSQKPLKLLHSGATWLIYSVGPNGLPDTATGEGGAGEEPTDDVVYEVRL
ncbi:MAG: hypothetical protein ACYDC1_16565 [Limisphaerales bacterium]